MRLAKLTTKDGQQLAVPPDKYMVMKHGGNVGLYFAGSELPNEGFILKGTFDEVVAEINGALLENGVVNVRGNFGGPFGKR